MDWQVYCAGIIFIIVYAIIISEKVHRTITALLGATIMIIIGIISQEEAINTIDFNTIGLLVGMMLLVGIIRKSGVFEYVAIVSAQKTKGDPIKILMVLAFITALASSLLDNVTTVLLIVPVTCAIAKRLDICPFPYLMIEIFASNIGGTATLIGDPPNIMIGGRTNLGFMDFIVNLAPIIIVILIVTVLLFALIYRKKLVVTEERKQSVMNLNGRKAIKDPVLLKKSMMVLALVLFGFFTHQYLKLEPASIALMGASLLMLITREHGPEVALLGVEWPTIFFFIGLFTLVGSLEKVGIIEMLAHQIINLTQGNLTITAISILWLSAIASAFIDNIPFTAAMIPLIKSIGQMTAGLPLEPLWWSLSLGACLGGNGTLVGASANIVVVGLSARHGVEISFIRFLKYGFPIMILSIIISTIYIYLRYLL